ncbi:MAG: hypothetical protein D6681_16210 [Calditrichaeota bacterium]|nr:MAG: hypothetical protein D6681_16210 [Calditrichota bacterium]
MSIQSPYIAGKPGPNPAVSPAWTSTPYYRALNEVPDTPAMGEFLADQVISPECLHDFRLTWIKVKPGKSVRLLYRAQGADFPGQQYFFHARTASPETGPAQAEALQARCFTPEHRHLFGKARRAAVYASPWHLLIQVFPADPGLPGLPRVVHSREVAKMLSSVIPECDGACAQVEADVVQYKPRRQCLIRYTLTTASVTESGECRKIFYGKLSPRALPVYTRLRQLHRVWSGGIFRFPEPAAFFPEPGLMLCREIPGVHLSLLPGEARFSELCARIGRGLGEFHRSPVRFVPRKDAAAELEALNYWGERFLRWFPEEAPRLRRLMEGIRIHFTRYTSPIFAPVHGDFHVANILVDGERLGLLDLEDGYMGNPAADVGFFYAQLKLLSLKVYRSPEALNEALQAFLEAYLTPAPRDVRAMVPGYCALYCLWCAYFQCFLRPTKSGWWERGQFMLQICEDIIARGTV